VLWHQLVELRAQIADAAARSYSIVVTAAVEPTAKTFTAPSPASEVRTTCMTPSVRSMTSPFASVENLRVPVWTGTPRGYADLHFRRDVV
jgi:hypothetical protein